MGPYPNTVLSAWQLALIAVVALTTLAGWLAAVYLAAREPRRDQAAAGSPAEPTGTTSARLTPAEASGSARKAA